MSILILAEHNNEEVKSSTLNTIGAASKISNDIEVLVVGSNTEGVCKEISNYQNDNKYLRIEVLNFLRLLYIYNIKNNMKRIIMLFETPKISARIKVETIINPK